MRFRLIIKKILVNMVIPIFLLANLLVFPASATNYWSQPRPPSGSNVITYDSNITNAATDGKASVGMGVHIWKYVEDYPYEGGDSLSLRVSVAANTRVGIKYDIKKVLYGWFDVSQPTGITEDNSGTWLNLPFYFIFHGVQYNRVWVCSNGFLSFDSESTNHIPQPIPNTDKPNSLIAPFWRDLNPSAGGSITYGTINEAPNRLFVISWNNVPNSGNGIPQSFQVIIAELNTIIPDILKEHNRIWFNYKSITKDYPTTVGVENQGGDRGSSYDYNSLYSESSLLVEYPSPGYRLSKLDIKLTKSDSYAIINILRDTNDLGGYNVVLQDPSVDLPVDAFLLSTEAAAAILLSEAAGIMFGNVFIVVELAWLLAGALSPPVHMADDAETWDPEAYATADAWSEDPSLPYHFPFDATFGALVLWRFTDPNILDHSLTITTIASYIDIVSYETYTVSTSVSLNMDYVNPPPRDEVIKIGAIGPMSWIQGQGIAEGTKLAAQQINLGPNGIDEGGAGDDGIIIGGNNYKVEIVTADTLRGMPDPTGTTGVAAASELVAAGCDFVVGGFRTEACMGAREIFMDYKKMFLITGAAADELIDCGTGTCGKCVRCNYDRYKYMFRVTPVNSSELLKAVSGYLKWLMIFKLMPMYTWGYAVPLVDETEPLKVAVITEALTWADVIHNYLTSETFWNAPAAAGYMGMNDTHPSVPYIMGGVDIAYTARVSPTTTDVSAELAGVKASGARLLIDVVSGPSGRTLASQWADMDVKAFLFGIDVPGQEIPLHWTATGGSCETEAFTVTSGSNTPMNSRTTAYYSAYMAQYGHAPIYTSYAAYDSVIGIEQTLELGPDATDGTADDPDWWTPGTDVTNLIPYMEAGVRDGSTILWDYSIGANYPNFGITAKFKYTGPNVMNLTNPGESPETWRAAPFIAGTASTPAAALALAKTAYAASYDPYGVNPDMKGTLHDLYSGPLVDVLGQDDSHGPFWLERWSRSAVGQWQEIEGDGSLEIVYPLTTTYATRTKIPERMYSLADVDLSPDGTIDGTDMLVIAQTWQSTPPASWANPIAALYSPWVAGGTFRGVDADIDQSYKVTIKDAGLIAKQWGAFDPDWDPTYGLP